MKVRKRSPGGMIYVLLAGVWFLTTLFPLYFTMISSFKDDQSIFSHFFAPPATWMVENYEKAESMIHILRAAGNSLLVSAVSIALMLAVAMMGAYAVSRRIVPGSGGIHTLLLAAMMIPIQAAIVPVVQMVNAVNLSDNLLALSVVYAGINLSMVFLILKNSIDSIPRDLDEAATIDGCGPFRTLRHVILPASKPAVATCAIISFLSIYNELPLANVLIRTKELRTVSQALLNLKGDFGTLYGISFAAIVVSVIPTLLMYMLAQEKVEKSICAGSVKG